MMDPYRAFRRILAGRCAVLFLTLGGLAFVATYWYCTSEENDAHEWAYTVFWYHAYSFVFLKKSNRLLVSSHGTR
jgi:hypothetical protein